MVSYSFSIIIPTCNKEKNLSFLLNSITKQAYKNFKVVVTNSFSINKAKFAVISKLVVNVSARQFEKEDIIKSLYKSIKAIFYQLFFEPIKKPIFDYQIGGYRYENED